MQDDADESAEAGATLREFRRLFGGACTDCACRYSPQDAVRNIALGFKNAPRCSLCLGKRLERDVTELHAQLHEYIKRKACYWQAWQEAERCEQIPDAANISVPVVAIESPIATGDWDAGDMACGELVLALRLRLANLSAGCLLNVRATDPAAPEDIPAWCRMCGHTLVSANHPMYVIQRKGT